MKKKIEIPAIHDNDLEEILSYHGLMDKIEKNELLCFKCKRILSIDNISALKVINDELVVFCDNPECIDSIINN